MTSLIVCCFEVCLPAVPSVCNDLPPDEAATVDLGKIEDVFKEEEDMFAMSLVFDFCSAMAHFCDLWRV